MKNIAKSALLFLTVALCVAGAQAQSTVMLKGDVPFSFVVGNRIYPAGQYTVKELGTEVEGWFGPDAHAFIIRTLPMGDESAPQATKLVFHRYGDDYYLAEVWSDGQSHSVKSSPALQKISRKGKFETVAVLMAPR